MALVQATTWTMYLSRRRGTIHSLERWRALAGYPKHATKIARSTPLRLVCHSFTSTIYLPILARKDGILIPYFLIRMCVRTVPQGESYNFIGMWRFVPTTGCCLSSETSTSISVSHEYFFVFLESDRNTFGRNFSLFLTFDLFASDSESPFGRRCVLREINSGWTFLRDLWWGVRVSSRAIFSSFRIRVMNLRAMEIDFHSLFTDNV